MIIMLLLALLSFDHHYYPESIDTLSASKHVYVRVAGTVTAVAITQDGDVTFRLKDAHGHTLGCVLAYSLHNSQPRVGVELIVSGRLKVYTPLDQPKVIELDPVELLEPVEE